MQDQLAYLIASVNRRLEDELGEKLRAEGVPVTPSGRETYERVQGIAADQQSRLLERLQGQQYEQLKSLLESLGARH
jgi:hypothetical protein